MNFGEALELLKAGKKVTRTGWNGKGAWVSMAFGRDVESINLWSRPARFWAEKQEDHKVHVLPHLILKTAQNEIQMGWQASQSDILAEDWIEVL